ncbi:MAG TPA: hypothetical protein VIK14_01250, partial [Ignavibacteria bacterium]
DLFTAIKITRHFILHVLCLNLIDLLVSRYNFMYSSANIDMKPEIPFMASLFSISILQKNILRRNVPK